MTVTTTGCTSQFSSGLSAQVIYVACHQQAVERERQRRPDVPATYTEMQSGTQMIMVPTTGKKAKIPVIIPTKPSLSPQNPITQRGR